MSERLSQKQRIGIVACLLGAMLLFMILHLDRINEWLGYLIFVLRPVLIGLVLAYLCNPIFRMFERRLFSGLRPYRFRRILSLLCTYIVLFLIFVTLVMLIVPQLVSSVLDFLGNYEGYLYNAIENVNGVIVSINQSFGITIPVLEQEGIKEAISNFLNNLQLQSFLESLLTYTNIASLLAMLRDAFFVVTDIIFGIFISVYILNSKEKQYAQTSRLRRAILSNEVNAKLENIVAIADRSFGGFLRGKLLDSTIVGILVYVIISIMQVPYSLLIAVIIAITDIVPVIGPFIGVIPSAVIILLTDPLKVIPFLLCILVVQQIDGNILAPKILGENTGVSSLCVLIAITLLGAIWGLVGMVIAVPLFATILELSGKFLEKRLVEKGLPVETEYYYGKKSEAHADPQPTNHKRKSKKNTPRPPVRHGGSGVLTTEERQLLRAYTLAVKHGVIEDYTHSDALSAFAEEYRPTAASEPTIESISKETE